MNISETNEKIGRLNIKAVLKKRSRKYEKEVNGNFITENYNHQN